MTTAVDMVAMKAISEQAASGQNGNRYLKLEGEETRVRILPPRTDMHGLPFVDKSQHYISGKYTDCLGEQDCPICRRMRALQAAQPDKESQNKVWKKYGASKSHLYRCRRGWRGEDSFSDLRAAQAHHRLLLERRGWRHD